MYIYLRTCFCSDPATFNDVCGGPSGTLSSGANLACAGQKATCANQLTATQSVCSSKTSLAMWYVLARLSPVRSGPSACSSSTYRGHSFLVWSA